MTKIKWKKAANKAALFTRENVEIEQESEIRAKWRTKMLTTWSIT